MAIGVDREPMRRRVEPHRLSVDANGHIGLLESQSDSAAAPPIRRSTVPTVHARVADKSLDALERVAIGLDQLEGGVEREEELECSVQLGAASALGRRQWPYWLAGKSVGQRSSTTNLGHWSVRSSGELVVLLRCPTDFPASQYGHWRRPRVSRTAQQHHQFAARPYRPVSQVGSTDSNSSSRSTLGGGRGTLPRSRRGLCDRTRPGSG
jgi:hypothetical protein